jgi:hypothetical protein
LGKSEVGSSDNRCENDENEDTFKRVCSPRGPAYFKRSHALMMGRWGALAVLNKIDVETIEVNKKNGARLVIVRAILGR